MIIGLIIAGILTGAISGFFGIGGGTVLVPMLMFIGIGIKEAVGVSIIQMIFSSIYGSYLNFKSKTLDFKDGLVIGFGGSVGALFSGYIVSIVPAFVLELVFLSLVAFAIYKFMNKTKEIKDKKSIDNRFILFTIGFAIGIIAMSIGVGGSILLTPILVSYLFYDIKKAASLGLFFVIFSSISGFISMFYFGTVNIYYGLIVGISSLIGVFLGIKVKNMMNADSYKKYILYLYIVVFSYTLYEVLT
jgi:uncharacterized membrane protein YfcA